MRRNWWIPFRNPFRGNPFRGGLFRRMVASYALVTVLSFLLLGTLVSRMIERYYIRSTTQDLLASGSQAATAFQSFLEDRIDASSLQQKLSLEEHSSGILFLVIPVGADLPAKLELWAHPSGNEFTSSELQAIGSGHQVAKFGQIPGHAGETISVAVPILTGGQAVGAVSIHAPFLALRQTIQAVIRIIWISAALALALAVVLTYWNSWRIAGPLIRLAGLAREVARGNFGVRLPETSADEVGRLAASFNHMAAELERQEAMRGDFLASVAHELRSPLTSIRGFSRAILDGTAGPEQQAHYLEIIRSEADRLARLTGDLLDLAQFDAGQMHLARAAMDLNELARRVMASLTPQVEAARLDLELATDIFPIMVLADRDRVEQILANLLNNAVRYSPPGGRIDIRIRRDDRVARVDVSDKGVGIPPEDLFRIWERFYRVDKSRSRALGGTGLGLALVKELVEAHGGTVGVESALGKGTTFWFTLPLV